VYKEHHEIKMHVITQSAPRIVNFGTRWSVARFARETQTVYLSDCRTAGLCVQEKNVLVVLWIETWFISVTVRKHRATQA
jgi:hypothetical protein